MKQYKLFTINPGSTSTKIAMFENDKMTFSANVSHEAFKLKEFKEIIDQFDYRKDTIVNELEKAGITLEDVDAFSARGGALVALEGGTYIVNDALHHHASIGFTVKHPAMLGAPLARYFSTIYGGSAFVVNPPDVDEFQETARLTGLANVYRESRIHALNQKEIGLVFAKKIGRSYNSLNLIIAHIGGGISVTAHRKGRMIDSNDNVNGDGPMAPTRCGALPVKAVIDMCLSGNYTEKEMKDKLTKTGGLVDHLGTSDVLEVTRMIESGSEKAKLVFDAMIYQIVKMIGSMAAVLKGEVDGIILTGGIAHNPFLVNAIKDSVAFIADVETMPGEFEMEALAAGALRVLRGEEEAKIYTGIPNYQPSAVIKV